MKKIICALVVGVPFVFPMQESHAFSLGDAVKIGGGLVDSALKEQEKKKQQEQEAKQRKLQDARKYADPVLRKYDVISNYRGVELSPQTQKKHSDLKFSYSGDNPETIRKLAQTLEGELSSYDSQIAAIEKQREVAQEKERQKRIVAEKERKKKEEAAKKQRQAQVEQERKEREAKKQELLAAEKAQQEKDLATKKAEKAKQRAQAEENQKAEKQRLLIALKERGVFNKTLSQFADRYPLMQLQLVATSFNGQVNFRKATNKLAKGATRPQRKKELCAYKGAHNGWIGQVAKLDSNNEGKGVLSIIFANDMFIKTHNNALSDMRAKTLLEPGTEIFDKAVTLNRGDIIQFDGYTFADKTDCIQEMSLTLKGSMQEPNYIFKFTDLKKIN